MSQKVKESLMYDFSFNLFLGSTALPNVKNVQDRQNAVKWIRFLKNNVRTIQEMRIRNDFMYYLVLNLQEGVMKPPFDKSPPNIPLTSMAYLLPEDTEEAAEGENNATPMSAMGCGKKSEIFRRSPDGGDFLISQPIPDIGAFCYLAVVTKKKN